VAAVIRLAVPEVAERLHLTLLTKHCNDRKRISQWLALGTEVKGTRHWKDETNGTEANISPFERSQLYRS
jgi:hypothetical protein